MGVFSKGAGALQEKRISSSPRSSGSGRSGRHVAARLRLAGRDTRDGNAPTSAAPSVCSSRSAMRLMIVRARSSPACQ